VTAFFKHTSVDIETLLKQHFLHVSRYKLFQHFFVIIKPEPKIVTAFLLST